MADAMNRFWREEGASHSIYYGGKLYFQNGHFKDYKNAANDRNCLFPVAGCITLLHSCSYMDFYFCFFLYRKRNIDLLVTHFARERILFVKKYKGSKLPAVLWLA